MSRSYKIAFIGEPGAGKTTCIGSISEVAPVLTDVDCTDELAAEKPTTTVALDYGEIRLDDDERLLLYGLPGQARFGFMFDIVSDGLLGVVVLVDAAAERPEKALAATLSAYRERLRGWPCIIALNKNPQPAPALFEACQRLLSEHGLVVPVLAIDARRREDVVSLFRMLFLLLEYGYESMEVSS